MTRDAHQHSPHPLKLETSLLSRARPVPYTGVQFVAIPEFQGIGTTVGQDISAAMAGTDTVAGALEKAQADVTGAMKRAGYIK
jgi:sorbitol/mannitol transport system substrate-binding protein